MECKCNQIAELNGVEAQDYAKSHLEKVRVGNWVIEYACLETGALWLMDFPHGDWHGGGPPRLWKMDENHGRVAAQLRWPVEGGARERLAGRIFLANLRFEQDEGLWSVIILLKQSIEDESRSQAVELRFLLPENLMEELTPGKKFILYEGPAKFIAEGEIG